MCTVLVRYAPGEEWPLLLAAVRDEFVDRAWDVPGAHWPAAPGLVGGRDRVAGGTWLAVRQDRPAVAALLNGVRLPASAGTARPSRGALPLAILTDVTELHARTVCDYDGFHLLRGTVDGVTVWSWDGLALTRQDLSPGDHIIVNHGVDTMDDPLVPHFAPLLAATATPPLKPGVEETASAWDGWVDLVRGDSLPEDDARALIVRVEFDGRTYGSTSASLVALNSEHVRFDFTATPDNPAWTTVPMEPR